MSRKCFYHPENDLHNFCLNRQCALPLCPKCIHIHLHQTNTKNHHIVPLIDVEEMISEQITTSISGLKVEISDVTEKSSPESYMTDYSELLEKYRKEAIDKVNRHFDLIEKELMAEITNKYNQHLAAYVTPLQEKLGNMEEYSRIICQGKSIEVLINLVHHDTINQVEALLQAIQMKKETINKQMPRLGYDSAGEIEVLPISFVEPPINYHVQLSEDRIMNDKTNSIDRIIELENRLFSIRTKKCC